MSLQPFGERLLPSVLDEIAATDPSRVLYSVTKTKNPADGFQDITAKEFSEAVDRCSWHLHESLGGQGSNFPTLLYMGPQDLVYGILVLASHKTGYKLLLNSPRNTLEAHLSLIDQTDCHVFLQPPVFPLPIVKQIQDARALKTVIIPDLQHWIGSGQHKPYPFNKSFSEARLDPFAVLHTSGSTGIPKPIVQRHGSISPQDAFNSLPSQGLPATYPAMCFNKRVYVAFPLFHCAGLTMLLAGPIYNQLTIVLGSFPPSAEVVDAVHVHGNVQESCLAPMILVELVKSPRYLDNLSLLDQITFGGGPCPQDVGDLVSTKTRLLNVMGSTECGTLPIQASKREDWAYMTASPVLGHEYRQVTDGLYEQVIVRKPELERYQGIFATFPDLQEWPMKDLYSKHPTDEDVWLYRGRSDDIIVLHTGEKFNPVDFEGIVNADPVVSAALVTGLGRFQISLLVEATNPPANETEKRQLIETLWPRIEKANSISPSHGQLHRNMILFTAPDRPMLRAGKGTVQRSLTIESYKSKLDALYKASERNHDYEVAPAPGNGSIADFQDTVKASVIESTKLQAAEIQPGSDFFELGVDSLQVTVLARKLNNFLVTMGKPPNVATRDVYANPSIAALSNILSQDQRINGHVEDNTVKLQDLYSRYSSNLPISARQTVARPEQSVILLTGATGSLGSYILDSLSKNARVKHIYLLNRGPGSLQRQQQSLASKGLSGLTDRITSLESNLSAPYFGLEIEVYKRLLHQVTDIIHNAWNVNFNLAIDSFASHIGAVRQMVDFSAHSTYGAKVVFVSSIGAVGNLGNPAEEQVYNDWNVPTASGYAQSKLISELVLDSAARHANIPVDVLRIGQVAGPRGSKGMWPQQEWFPSLVASSKHLGVLPDSLGSMDSVDWVPVDVLGQSVVEVALLRTPQPEQPGASFHHFSNPRRVEWGTLAPVVAKKLGQNIRVVSLSNWVEALKSSAVGADVTPNPATKLLDFFENLASEKALSLKVEKVLQVSPALAELEPVNQEWLENWIKQWGL